MIGKIAQFYHDPTLYGHILIKPSIEVYKFCTAPIESYYDTNSPHVRITWLSSLTFEVVRYHFDSEKKSHRYTISTEFIGQKYLNVGMEWITRRIFGPFLYAVTVPLGIIGLISKIAYSLILSLSNHSLFNQDRFFGHFFTRLPAICHQFAEDPLCWHLNANGQDKRAYIREFAFGKIIFKQDPSLIEQFIPYELVEWPLRRIVGRIAVITSLPLAAIGLMVKLIDAQLRAKSCLR